jgi:uncharacterized protein (TIGR03083 family)
MTCIWPDVGRIRPFTHEEAMLLQHHELECMLTVLRSLDEEDWQTSTDCPEWDIRAMCQHVLGGCEAGASIRETIHQLRQAQAYRKKHGGPLEVALSHVQVSERADLNQAQILMRLETIAPRTVSRRTRLPVLLRRYVRFTVDSPARESWKLGYLIDTVALRDLWMHRIDVNYALGRLPDLNAQHDGRIVADIVAEWAHRHRKPFDLELTGTAGGRYAHKPDHPHAEHLSLDAVEFCRTLAGRAQAAGLLTTVVPF